MGIHCLINGLEMNSWLLHGQERYEWGLQWLGNRWDMNITGDWINEDGDVCHS